MQVRFMLTCLCDALYGVVGSATVRVLEHAGCEVIFPEDQTCCGQPPFNAGDRIAAKQIAESTLRVFDVRSEIPVVVPSASCAAMVRDGYPMLGIAKIPPVFELSEFLLDHLRIDRWPLKPGSPARPKRVALHQACHGRMLHLGDRQKRLMGLVPGLELVDFAQQDQCCGFGGAFSITHGAVSEGIGLEKLRCLMESGVDTVIGGDMGCFVHLESLARRHDYPLKFRHYAELLAEAIP